MTTNRNPRRRGVTLLLVLGLMAMFAMLIVAFMTVVTLYRSASETAAKIKPMASDVQSIVSGKTDTDAALLKLLVGDKLQSVIGPYSILEDIFGHPTYVDGNGVTQDLLKGTFPSANDTNRKIRLANDYDFSTKPKISGMWMFNASELSLDKLKNNNPAPLELAGSILTVVSLPQGQNKPKELLNRSFRIFKVIPGEQDCFVYIVPPVGEFKYADFDDCTYVINGAPFSGTGPGLPTTLSTSAGFAQLTQTDLDSDNNAKLILAQRPNILAPNTPGSDTNSNKPVYRNYLEKSLVMMNSDYTFPDHLHMFLAWLGGGKTIAGGSGVIPSFHRPWGVMTTSAATVRKTVLRPSPHDHPDFDGSNPKLNLSNFNTNIKAPSGTPHPWDVDNDNDGTPDSVWIDAGLGIYVDPKTNKTYKRLVSYLVIDMDGRLNVNVHGNEAQQSSDFNTFDDTFAPMNGVTGSLKIRGIGNGPAEVRLDKPIGTSVLKQLTNGDNVPRPGRYGKEYRSEDKRNPGNVKLLDSADDSDTMLWLDAKQGINYGAYDYLTADTMGGTLPDWCGQSALTFDPLGNRVVNLPWKPVYLGSPYLMNVYGKGIDEAPFNMEELEAVLRTSGDADFKALPQRLRKLLNETTAGDTSNQRLNITAWSNDLPCPSRFMGIFTDGSTHTPDWSIYRKVLRIAAKANGDPDYDKAGAILALLPIEIRQGLRVNLNRPSLSLSGNWTGGDHDTGLLERAKFAQEIFYLLMVLCYDEIKGGYSESSIGTVERLAQWSVNLVDFMDPDATMTPFIYSSDPFSPNLPYDNNNVGATGLYALLKKKFMDGATSPPTPTDPPPFDLTADSNQTDLHLIWGMEKPEVAITETLATHNRRVADSIEEASASADGTPVICDTTQTPPGCGEDHRRCTMTCVNYKEKHDKDFDQVLLPEASLYVELYYRGDPKRSHVSADLTSSGNNKIDLAKRTTEDDYVWRLAIGQKTQGKPADPRVDSNDLTVGMANRTFQPTQWTGVGDEGDAELIGAQKVTLERFIWFGSGAPTTSQLPGNCSYWNADPAVLLEPNQHLLIVPRDTTSFKEIEGPTYSDPAAEEGEGGESGGEAATPSPDKIMVSQFTAKDRAKKPVVMIANGAVPTNGVNISAPAGGYTATVPAGTPFDTDELFSYGTIPRYKAIFLQRLADPNRQYDPVANPYITVDWNMVDLHVFNQVKDKEAALTASQETNESGETIHQWDDGKINFGTRQTGDTSVYKTETGALPNLWDRSVISGSKPDGINALELVTEKSAGKSTVNSTLGYLNNFSGVTNKPADAGSEGGGEEVPLGSSDIASLDPTASISGLYLGAPPLKHPFVALPWNDSPFANPYEVMQVPACSAGTFGVSFHDKHTNISSSPLGAGGRFAGDSTNIGYLLSFEHSDTGSNSLNLVRFLDQVDVPSRFAGTIVGLANDSPIYSYREPGKINLNTATEAAWEGLQGNRSNAVWPTYNNGTLGSDLQLRLNTQQPFRSSSSVDLIPYPESGVCKPAEATLLGQGSSGLFFRGEEDKVPDIASNMYNKYENVARLSSMTTNRSNVFAVWITVGYFEVQRFAGNNRAQEAKDAHPDPTSTTTPPASLLAHITNNDVFDAVYPDGYILGKEKGLDDGTIKRHRSFAVIDRTIPVGFRRGEKMNAENVILLQKTLE